MGVRFSCFSKRLFFGRLARYDRIQDCYSRNERVASLKVRTRWGRKRKKKLILPNIKIEDAGVQLTGHFANQKIKEIFEGKEFAEVCFRDFKLIDLAAAHEIEKSPKIHSLAISSKVTRPALSKLMQVPGLIDVLVSEFVGCGRLRDFAKGADVESFRNYYALRNADFIQIADLPKLQTLTAHCAEFGPKAVQKLSSVETLKVVDFEGVRFTDEMAKALSKSETITDVGLPATQLSRVGLKSISEMGQLRYLDIWANGFTAEDLDLLADHPSLEQIELGGFGGDSERQLKACDVIPKLERLPALKTVYFENVVCTDEEIQYLSRRYSFRLLQG